MDDRTRLDSATALARTPLFSHLGRLELARLAGELEEHRYSAGQVIVREGDRPDGFYVIKEGCATVLAGAVQSAASDGEGATVLRSLGPG